MKTCKQCNTENSDSAKFCVNCGQRLQVPQAETPAAAPQPTGSGRRSSTASASANSPQTSTPNPPPTRRPPNSGRRTPPQVKGKTYAQGKEPALALILSLFIPGVGQFYNGDTKKGLLMLGLAVVGAFIIIGWLVAVIWSTIDAYQVAAGKSPLWQ